MVVCPALDLPKYAFQVAFVKGITHGLELAQRFVSPGLTAQDPYMSCAQQDPQFAQAAHSLAFHRWVVGWPSKSFVRKGIEAYLTVLIEATWSKNASSRYT
jgi:hypothetical protein